MSKWTKKLTYGTAIIICFIMGFQNMMPVSAATTSTNGWKCTTCGNLTVLEVRPGILIGESDPMQCDLREHYTTGCRVVRELLEDQYWVTCFTCGVSSRSGQSDPYYGSVIRHITIAKVIREEA